jgi:hypothetical protein
MIQEVEQSLDEKLRPGSEVHDKLLGTLNRWASDSRDHMHKRKADFEEVDTNLRPWLDAEDVDDHCDDDIKKRVNIKVGMTYWTLMTRTAEKFAQIDSKDPFFHVEAGTSKNEDVFGSRALEAYLAQNLRESEYRKKVWQLLFDGERYGVSISHDWWQDVYKWRKRKEPPLAIALPPNMRRLIFGDAQVEHAKVDEGNRFDVIAPVNYLPDPAVPISEVQRGQRTGFTGTVNWLHLAQARLDRNEGPYFNVDAARKSGTWVDSSTENSGLNIGGDLEMDDSSPYPNQQIVWMQVKIIPREFGLSDVDRVQIWQFSVINEKVIVEAHPILGSSDEFTVSVACSDHDQHAPFTPGMGTILAPSETFANWLATSHQVAAQTALNNRIIYSRTLFDEADVYDATPGAPIALTEEGDHLMAYGGTPIDHMYSQLKVFDVTRGNLEFLQLFMTFVQRQSATPDTVQGMPLQSKRTLGEVDAVQSNAIKRIGAPTNLQDETLFAKMGERWIRNAMDFASMEKVIALGDTHRAEMRQAFITVNRDAFRDLSYHYIPHTSSAAIDPNRAPAAWGMMMQMLGQSPELWLSPDPETGKKIYPHRVLQNVARAQGLRNINQIYGPANIQVVPDEQIQQGAQAGNLVPMGG